jgi:DNA-binding GntR family transcriptional regulator
MDGWRWSAGACDHGCVPDRPPVPPGRRVEADLRARIAAGEWTTDDRLPAVAELAVHYGVARGTVTAALRKIAADGLVEIVPSWGVFYKGRGS